MTPTLNDCTFPPLQPPYDEGLRQAVVFILEKFSVVGIIAAGTIIRGRPAATSDFDMYIFHDGNFRQRLQRRFNGIPTEIFVNTIDTAKTYLTSEIERGRPSTAHMLSTGFVIFESDPTIQRLREKAREVLQCNPNPTQKFLLQKRYGLATQFEDGLDMRESDPEAAIMILAMAVRDMLQYAFWKANRWLPRDKDLLDATASLDPQLCEWGRAFFSTPDQATKIELAQKIADVTIETHGFFEWDGDPDPLEPSI